MGDGCGRGQPGAGPGAPSPAGAALFVAALGIGWAVFSRVRLGAAAAPALAPAAYPPHPANAPVGATTGLAPGRVAWAHDPQVTTWYGTSTGSRQRWFDKISQSEATAMMQWAVLGYADATTTGDAFFFVDTNPPCFELFVC